MAIFTDFAATTNLSADKSDNSAVDGHAIMRSLSASDDVRNTFLNILNWYNEHCTKPWFYGVSLAKNNKHSLAAALNLNVEDVMVVLKLFGLVTKYGEGMRVVKQVDELRRNKWLQKYIKDENSIQIFTSKSLKASRSKKIFIRLGTDDDKKHCPAWQNIDDKPPYPSDRRIFLQM